MNAFDSTFLRDGTGTRVPVVSRINISFARDVEWHGDFEGSRLKDELARPSQIRYERVERETLTRSKYVKRPTYVD